MAAALPADLTHQHQNYWHPISPLAPKALGQTWSDLAQAAAVAHAPDSRIDRADAGAQSSLTLAA